MIASLRIVIGRSSEKNMNNKFSIVIAALALGINIYSAGLARGFDFHFRGQFEFSESRIAGSEYLYICVLIFVFTILQFTKRGMLSSFICIGALCLILFHYTDIYASKSLLSDEGSPYSLLLRESAPLDVTSFSLIVVLWVYQLVIITTRLWHKGEIRSI